MFDFSRESKKLNKIFLEAREFTKQNIVKKGKFITREKEKEFEKIKIKFNEKIKQIKNYISSNNFILTNMQKNFLELIEENFLVISKNFKVYCETLWHDRIEIEHGLLEKQVERVKELEEKYEGITKEFLTAMALFITLFSVITVNTKLFEGNLNIYMVVITNLTILIAISVIFAFVFQIFNYKPRKQKNDEEKRSCFVKFFKEGFFRFIITGLIIALVIALWWYNKSTSDNEGDDNENTNSSSNLSQVESSTTAVSNFSTGVNVVITY